MEDSEKCIDRRCRGIMKREPEKELGRIKKHFICPVCNRTKRVLEAVGGPTPKWAAPRGMEVSYE